MAFLARLMHSITTVSLAILRWWSGARAHHHVTEEGIRMRVLRIRRPGRPRAVFIHGFSDRPETFLATASRLRDFDVTLPALPGFHDGIRDGVRYEVHQYARWIAAALDAEGVRDAHICGNSLGGAAALVLASERPDLVRSLIPLDSAGVEAPGVSSVHDEIRAGHNLFEVRTAAQVPGFLGRIFHRPPRLGPAGPLFAAELASKADTYATIMHHLHEEGDRLGGTEIVELAAIERPTLVAWGDQDSLFPLAVGEHLCSRIEGARLHVFEATGHCPHLERPFALAKVAGGFWREVEAGHASG